MARQPKFRRGWVLRVVLAKQVNYSQLNVESEPQMPRKSITKIPRQFVGFDVAEYKIKCFGCIPFILHSLSNVNQYQIRMIIYSYFALLYAIK